MSPVYVFFYKCTVLIVSLPQYMTDQIAVYSSQVKENGVLENNTLS